MSADSVAATSRGAKRTHSAPTAILAQSARFHVAVFPLLCVLRRLRDTKDKLLCSVSGQGHAATPGTRSVQLNLKSIAFSRIPRVSAVKSQLKRQPIAFFVGERSRSSAQDENGDSEA